MIHSVILKVLFALLRSFWLLLYASQSLKILQLYKMKSVSSPECFFKIEHRGILVFIQHSTTQVHPRSHPTLSDSKILILILITKNLSLGMRTGERGEIGRDGGGETWKYRERKVNWEGDIWKIKHKTRSRCLQCSWLCGPQDN